MKLLFIASDPMEFAGLLRRCTQVRQLELAADWTRVAALGDSEIVMAANGIGWKRAGAATDAALAKFAADGIVSIGFCGALDQKMTIGDVVVGNKVGRYNAREVAASVPAHCGAICSIDHIARSAAEKSKLRATGAIAVEMEAAGVAERAESHQLPFFCIKTVTDLAGETLTNDFNAALRSDGHFDTIKILASTLRKPWARLPELFRLRSRCHLASRSLGDFIADCRF